MAEITFTRQMIRHSIGRMARVEFFMRYGNTLPRNVGDVSGDTNTTILVGDSDLIQDTDFWQGDWLYLASTDEERLILNSSSDGKLVPEWAFTNAPTSDDTYEIWGLWAPSDVNHKINMSIRNAWRFFPNIVTAETLVIQEGRTTYDLASSEFNQTTDDNFPQVAEVLQIYVETSRSRVTGQITSTSANSTSFNDTLYVFDSDDVPDSDWLLSVYDGTGRGDLREMASVDSDLVFIVDTDPSADYDTTTRYALWNPSTEQFDDWYRLTAARFDQVENPDFMYLPQVYPAANGLRIRITYEAQSSDLSADSDVTRVPEEYVVYKSLSILYDGLVGDNRVDRSAHAGLAEYYDQLAEKFIRDNGRRLPAQTLWSEEDVGSYSGNIDDANPLDWNWG